MPSIMELLHHAGQISARAYRRLDTARHELEPRQLTVMLAISQHADKHAMPSQSDICEATGIDRSTMADIVRRLVVRGMVKRKRTRDDARRYAISLSELGASVIGAAEAARRKAENDLLRRVKPADSKALERALLAIIEAGKAADPLQKAA